MFLSIEKTFIIPHYVSKYEFLPKNHIILHSKNCTNSNACTCNHHKLKICSSTKYLGIIMNSDLKWIDHKNTLITKLKKLTYAFKQVKSILKYKPLKNSI